jgi:hypothetical protein
MLNGSDYHIFDQITVKSIGTSYSRVILIDNDASYNTFTNCVFEGAVATSYGVTDKTVIYEDNGTNTNNSFTNNHILNGTYGFYSQYGPDLVISKNVFENQFSSNTSYSSYEGIFLSFCDQNIQIERNKIDITNGYCGIYLNYCDGSSTNRGLIANNFIHTGGSGGSVFGIIISTTLR